MDVINARASLLGLGLSLLVTTACGPGLAGSEAQSAGVTTSNTEADTSTTMIPPDDGSGTESETKAETETTAEPSESLTSFVPGTDDGPWIADCDPFAQDCPEGEKCVPYASTGQWWDDNKCVPVTGSQAAGEPCIYDGSVDATDDCDADSTCWNTQEIDGELVGVCYPFCQGSPENPMCPGGSYCSVNGDGTIALCLWTCDPVLQDCADGEGCYWAGAEFTCVPTTEDIPVGEGCGFVNDCERGLMCVAADSLPSCEFANCCTSFCELMVGDMQCDALLPGTSCAAFFEEGLAPAGLEHVGVCVVA